jgi:hypothetical protein
MARCHPAAGHRTAPLHRATAPSSARNASHANEWKHPFADALAFHIGSIRVKLINLEPLELALKAISSPFPRAWMPVRHCLSFPDPPINAVRDLPARRAIFFPCSLRLAPRHRSKELGC